MAHSYTSWKQYTTCPRQFFHQRVERSCRSEMGPEALRGVEEHAHIERTLRGQAPLPAALDAAVGGYVRVVQQAVDSGRWVPLIEHDLAIGQSHVVLPPKFAWAVGKADLILLDNLATPVYAKLYDWKSGKVRHSPEQAYFYAWLLSHTFPTLQSVQYRFIWYNHGVVTPREEDGDSGEVRFTEESRAPNHPWDVKLREIDNASLQHSAEAFPMKRSGLCNGWCPAKQCPNWRPKR